MARLLSGLFAAASSRSYAFFAFLWGGGASWLGAYDGLLTMARTAPVFGFRATTAPRWLPRAFHATRWTWGSIVSSTDAPCGLRPGGRAEMRGKNSWSAVPARNGPMADSSPVDDPKTAA